MTQKKTDPVPAKKWSLGTRLLSFHYAVAGLVHLVRQEPNARIHALATAVALGLGAYHGLGRTGWAVLLLAIGPVWTAEALNTAIEMLCDLCCDGRFHPVVKRIKDVAAGAVLVAAAVSVAVGVLLFS